MKKNSDPAVTSLSQIKRRKEVEATEYELMSSFPACPRPGRPPPSSRLLYELLVHRAPHLGGCLGVIGRSNTNHDRNGSAGDDGDSVCEQGLGGCDLSSECRGLLVHRLGNAGRLAWVALAPVVQEFLMEQDRVRLRQVRKAWLYETSTIGGKDDGCSWGKDISSRKQVRERNRGSSARDTVQMCENDAFKGCRPEGDNRSWAKENKGPCALSYGGKLHAGRGWDDRDGSSIGSHAKQWRNDGNLGVGRNLLHKKECESSETQQRRLPSHVFSSSDFSSSLTSQDIKLASPKACVRAGVELRGLIMRDHLVKPLKKIVEPPSQGREYCSFEAMSGERLQSHLASKFSSIRPRCSMEYYQSWLLRRGRASQDRGCKEEASTVRTNSSQAHLLDMKKTRTGALGIQRSSPVEEELAQEISDITSSPCTHQNKVFILNLDEAMHSRQRHHQHFNKESTKDTIIKPADNCEGQAHGIRRIPHPPTSSSTRSVGKHPCHRFALTMSRQAQVRGTTKTDDGLSKQSVECVHSIPVRRQGWVLRWKKQRGKNKEEAACEPEGGLQPKQVQGQGSEQREWTTAVIAPRFSTLDNLLLQVSGSLGETGEPMVGRGEEYTSVGITTSVCEGIIADAGVHCGSNRANAGKDVCVSEDPMLEGLDGGNLKHQLEKSDKRCDSQEQYHCVDASDRDSTPLIAEATVGNTSARLPKGLELFSLSPMGSEDGAVKCQIVTTTAIYAGVSMSETCAENDESVKVEEGTGNEENERATIEVGPAANNIDKAYSDVSLAAAPAEGATTTLVNATHHGVEQSGVEKHDAMQEHWKGGGEGEVEKFPGQLQGRRQQGSHHSEITGKEIHEEKEARPQEHALPSTTADVASAADAESK
ncbi:unnamed protein product, partial [Choristocarpus tenellus]